MKTLSIQQPWASLICSGIKDVENRTWKTTHALGRILIHAGAKKAPRDFLDTVPLEWAMAISHEQIFGNIPFFEEMPLSAIIGYATVTGFADSTDSLWDAGEGTVKWELEDMHLFDQPIEGVKGRLGLFDYPLDEDSLPPAHRVELRRPSLVDGLLTVPVAASVYDDVAAGSESFEIDLDGTLWGILAGSDGNLLPVSRIRFECGGRTLIADAEAPCILDVTDLRTGEAIVVDGIFGERLPWKYFSVRLMDVREA